MMKNICANCGTFIVKRAESDPYLCRDCEKLLEGAEREERFPSIDN